LLRLLGFGSARLKLDEPGSAREKARLEELEEVNKVRTFKFMGEFC